MWHRRQPGVLGQRDTGPRTAAALAATFGPLAGARRLPRWHELVLAAADQVRAAHAVQRIAQHRPVVRIVVAQERLVEPALREPLHGMDALARPDRSQRVISGVVHRRRGRHRRRQERLHLIGAEAVLLEPDREREHVLVGGARVRRDEVRDQVLLLARLRAVAIEELLALIAMDCNTAAVTDKATLFDVTPSCVAVILLVPIATPLTRPVALTLATAEFELFQVAAPARLWVLPSLKVPVAVN